MSGGTWQYSQYRIQDLARSEIPVLLLTAALTEHEIDWAEACDTSKEEASERVYQLWKHVFDALYDDNHAECPEWMRGQCPLDSQ